MLHGIRYARNRAGHGFASVLNYQDGVVYPLRYPIMYGDYRWRPVADLILREGKPDAAAREVYDQRLAGNPVTDALDDALTWLRAEHDRRDVG